MRAMTALKVSQDTSHDRDGPRTGIVLAFAILYLVWGSTYLAIRYAVETIPPLLMVGTRFLAAGALLYAWQLIGAARRRERLRPTLAEWRRESVIALLLISTAYGLVAWAELTVPSGIVALLAATTPLWMVVLPAFANGRQRPTALALGGVALGIVGQALLLAPGSLAGQTVNPLGAAAVVLASIAWAIGSLWSRRPPQPADALTASGIAYLLAGSFSSNYYGIPRSTKDADFVVELRGGVGRDFMARLLNRERNSRRRLGFFRKAPRMTLLVIIDWSSFTPRQCMQK